MQFPWIYLHRKYKRLSVNFVWILTFLKKMMLKNDMVPLVNRFAMHHFRSGFLIVVTDVWTRSLLTPVSWFHYQFAATLCLFFYCYKWLLRAPSSSGRFQWRATFITFLSTQHTPSRVPQDAARNAAPQSTSSWTAFFLTFWFYFSWMRKIKTNLTNICT